MTVEKPQGFYPGAEDDGFGLTFEFTFDASLQYFQPDSCNTLCVSKRNQVQNYVRRGIGEATGLDMTTVLFPKNLPTNNVEIVYSKVSRRRATTIKALVTYRTSLRPLIIDVFAKLDGRINVVTATVDSGNDARVFGMSDVTAKETSLKFVDYSGTFPPTQKTAIVIDATNAPTRVSEGNSGEPTSAPTTTGSAPSVSPTDSANDGAPTASPNTADSSEDTAESTTDNTGLIVLIAVIALVVIAGVTIIVILYKRRSAGSYTSANGTAGRQQTYDNPTYAQGSAPENKQPGTVREQNGRKVLMLDPYGDQAPRTAPTNPSAEDDC